MMLIAISLRCCTMKFDRYIQEDYSLSTLLTAKGDIKSDSKRPNTARLIFHYDFHMKAYSMSGDQTFYLRFILSSALKRGENVIV